MKDSFNEKYQKILKDSRLFYESSLKFINIKEAENKDFYSKYIKIFDDEYNENAVDEMFIEYDISESIVFEAHEDAKLKKNVINKIMQMNSGYGQIRLSFLLANVSNRFKENNGISKVEDIPIYIYKFSFSNPGNIIGRIFTSFGFTFSLDNGSIKDKYEFEAKTFKESIGSANGLVVDAGNCILMMLNIDDFSEWTIVHEMFHILQLFKNENDDKDGIEENEIRSLQLSKNDLDYLYKWKEFETRIKVDLISQLDEVYWKFYNSISRRLFIEKFITQCSTACPMKDNEVIEKILMYNLKNDDITALRLFLSTFLIKNKLYNDKAIEWLYDEF